MRILLAEDDGITRRLLSAMLSAYGKCDGVVDGKSAVEAFEQAWEDGDPYQLVCLDIMMPELNGHEVLQSIREFENRYNLKDDERAFIIMMTALGDEENFLQAHMAGSEWYLTKPIERQSLDELMTELGLK